MSSNVFSTDILSSERSASTISIRKYQFVVIEKNGNRRKYELGKQEEVKIGKMTDNDIVINDSTVSRYHVSIQSLENNRFKLVDQNSTNGTRINNVRVEEAYLNHNDVIGVGNTKILFQTYDEGIQIEPSKKTKFGDLVGKSRKMLQIFGMLEKISPTNTTVIIESETGTGKELVAKAIHEHSHRNKKPFIVFDCSAIAPNLIESELFGHMRGSFTGATSDHVGAFEAANGGTIFLDEIGELKLDLQPKLLRALEQKEIRRVGSTKPIKLDVRVISATNRDLKLEVEQGNFREDLYYRLSVIKVCMPALREKIEDIPIIAERILARAKFNRDHEDKIIVEKIDDDAMNILQSYHWPGNVRELHNILERVVSFAENHTVKAAHLQFVFSEIDFANDVTMNLSNLDFEGSFKEGKQAVLESFEKEYLQKLLEKNHGNISKTAREAKLDRSHLHRLINKYDLSYEDN